MVRIEMEETEDAVPSPPKASASTRKTTDSSGGASTSNASKDPSDGFETASDGELGDSGDERQEHPDQHPQEEEQIPALTEDEIKEKALAEANNAKLAGNKLFGEGKYEEAILEYDRALQIAPDMPSAVELRSICHGNRGVCFLKLEKYNDTIKECTKAIELNPAYVKALSRRGEAHEKLENFEEAIHDMKKILELDSSNEQARKALRRLEPLAEQKREKDEGRDDWKVERCRQLFVGSLWYEHGQLQGCQRSQHWFLFNFVPAIVCLILDLSICIYVHRKRKVYEKPIPV